MARRNHGVLGMSRLRHHAIPSHAPSAIRAVQMPTIASNAQWSSVFAGGRSSGGTESSPITLVSVLKPTSHESKPGIPIPPLTPSEVQRPPMYSVTCVCGRLHALHGGELDRLVLGDRAGGGVAHRELDRRRDRRDRERDQQSEPVVAVPPAAQHPDGVDRRHEEAR